MNRFINRVTLWLTVVLMAALQWIEAAVAEVRQRALRLRGIRPIAGAAKYGFDDMAFTIDQTDGGAPTPLTDYITEISGFKVTKITEESHAMGDSWVEHLLAGIRRGESFTIGGFYDDTATTGPDVVLNTSVHVVTRSVVITWGSTKTSSFEAWIVDYERGATRGGLTKFKATIQPTGAVTEA